MVSTPESRAAGSPLAGGVDPQRGFARRTEDLHDRRIARLETTENGAALLERMAAGQSDVIRDILAQLGSAELEVVGAALDVLQAGLKRTTQTISETLLTPQGTPA